MTPALFPDEPIPPGWDAPEGYFDYFDVGGGATDQLLSEFPSYVPGLETPGNAFISGPYIPSPEPPKKNTDLMLQAGVGSYAGLIGLLPALSKLAPQVANAIKNFLSSNQGKAIAGAVAGAGAIAGAVGLFNVPEIEVNGKQYVVAKSWDTGTAKFYLLEDGRIACRKLSGVWKFWRPRKHLVIPTNPRVGTLVKANKRVSRLMKSFGTKLNRRRKK